MLRTLFGSCRPKHKETKTMARLLAQEQGKPLKGLGSEFELGGCGAWMGAVADSTCRSKPFRKMIKDMWNYTACQSASSVRLRPGTGRS